RRWHITMGTWFKDYLFYPLSVSGPMLKFSRYSRQKLGDGLGKRLPVYVSTIIVWFTTGLWHGASWNFIVWGLLNGAVIIVSMECQPLYDWFHGRFNVKDSFWFRLFQVVRTILLMSAIRMFDCYRDVPLTFRMLGTMFTRFNIGALSLEALLGLGLGLPDYAVLLLGLAALVWVSLVQRSGSVRDKLAGKPFVLRYAAYYVLIVSILVFGAYGIGYDASQFIYNQF
ncbi:MAG TPA: MBOAT family protein, partial [Bacillota bacterium]|nr:MBOAT family protein [Bacillota bacterium]